MNSRRSTLVITIVSLLAVAGGSLAVLLAFHRDQRARIGEEILYDDFGFCVIAVDQASAIGPENARVACGNSEHFVVVRLEVRNHARRVDFDPASFVPRLEDAGDRTYEVDAAAAASKHAQSGTPPDPTPIPAGTSRTSDLVFRVPASARGLRLRIGWHEPFAGIDELVSGDRTVLLAPAE